MTMHVTTHGEGAPICFIHGAGNSKVLWYYQREYFKHLAKVVLLDLPGHGEAPGDALNSVGAYGKEVCRGIEESGGEPAVLVGHSMGGAVAMAVAVECPEVVKGLVVIGSGARLRVLPEILDLIMEDKEGVARRIIDLAFSESASTEMKELALERYMRTAKETIFQDFTACNRFDLMEAVSSIGAPTLIICGTKDVLTPPGYSEFLHRAIPGSELVLIHDTGHMAMLEKPVELNAAIEDFLRRRCGVPECSAS